MPAACAAMCQAHYTVPDLACNQTPDALLMTAAGSPLPCCIFLFLLSILDLPSDFAMTADWQGAVVRRGSS